MNFTSYNTSLIATWKNLRPSLTSKMEETLGKVVLTNPSGILEDQFATPMMQQYKKAKEHAPAALIFFRMGDFYELFGLDALIASDVCELTLTSRDKNSKNPIAMAGVPVISYKNAIKKCVECGFHVAICEQVEDPKDTKKIVKREVVQILTPGFLGDLDDILDSQNKTAIENRYIASVFYNKNEKTHAFAYLDVSTGDFSLTGDLEFEALIEEIQKLSPKEIIVSKNTSKLYEYLESDPEFSRLRVIPIESWLFKSYKNSYDLLLEFFDKTSLNSFGFEKFKGSVEACAFILNYVKNHQKIVLKNIKFIHIYDRSDYLILDKATIEHLNLLSSENTQCQGSLFHYLNKCLTTLGSRFLFKRIRYPYKKIQDIQKTQNAVLELLENPQLLEAFESSLSSVCDLSKILSRCAISPLESRYLLLLRQSLRSSRDLFSNIKKSFKKTTFFKLLESFDTQRLSLCLDFLNRFLKDDNEIESSSEQAYCIREGFSKELDDILSLEKQFSSKIKDIELKERENSSIQNLKIKFNKVFGYYFEVSKGKLSLVPKHFIRKQTLVNAERFVTEELKSLEEKYFDSASLKDKHVLFLLQKAREEILKYSYDITKLIEHISYFDYTYALSKVSSQEGFSRPKISFHNLTVLKDSFHPLLKEYALHKDNFVNNDVFLGELTKLPKNHFAFANTDSLIHLITGPNMSGKSTIMRQVAVVQTLFQLGSFVPAKKAELGVCDKIYTRIGSADFAFKNQSTFMVEMIEASHMLKFASEKSLLLLDEIGRGTSTYDGLSLACAILEGIQNKISARTLFSTHYHELFELLKSKNNITAMHLEVIQSKEKEKAQDKVIFSHKYTKGQSLSSYGIYVAKLAGLPEALLERAKEVHKELTKSQTPKYQTHPIKSQTIHTTPLPIEESSSTNNNELEVIHHILSLDLNAVTPKDALIFLYKFKERLKQKKKPFARSLKTYEKTLF